MSVSPYFGSAPPKPTDKLNGDVAISFSCSPANTHQLIELALAEVQALQVRPQIARMACLVAEGIKAQDALTRLQINILDGSLAALSLIQGEAGCIDTAWQRVY